MENREQFRDLTKSKMMDVHDNLTGSLWVPLTVGNVMSKDVITISPVETVVSAATIMSDKNASCIIVVDNGNVVGIFTETDLLERIADKNSNLDNIVVSEIMSSPVQSVSPNESVFMT